MKTSDMLKGEYLKKEDVGEAGMIFTIETVEAQQVSFQDGPEETKFVMTFVERDIYGNENKLILNFTNITKTEEIFESGDTDDWVGKQIVLYNEPDVKIGQKKVGGIRVKSVTQQAPTVPQNAVAQAPQAGSFDDYIQEPDAA